MDRSLFPEFPDRHPPAPKPPSCCEGLRTPIGVPTITWEVVHRLSHSRVSFSVEAIAGLAQCNERQAATAIRNAGQRGWITPVHPETRSAAPVQIWVGCLAKRR